MHLAKKTHIVALHSSKIAVGVANLWRKFTGKFLRAAEG